MQTGLTEHAGDDLLERYSMGTLPESQLEPLEEHLLICCDCREKLKETDDFVRATRAAAVKLADERRPAGIGWRKYLPFFAMIPKPVWAFGSVLLVLSFLWLSGIWRRPLDLRNPPVAVLLHSSRGPASLGVSQAPGGKPLLLEMDLTEIPSLSSYGLEVVDSQGRLVSGATGSPSNGRLSVPLPGSLGQGRYWVRLYRTEPRKELLREYGLEVLP